jgi:probable HAF family extracellular repeat protein
VIVGQSYTLNNATVEAFKYVNGIMTGLGNLGGLPGNSKANGVSADGSVIVGRSWLDKITYHAFKYSDGIMTDLGSLDGSVGKSTAYAVSADGSTIVGNSYYTGGGTNSHAFKYANDTMTDLGTLGGTWASANGVSPDGLVIVGSSTTASGTTHAFVYGAWANGGLVDVQNTYSAIAANGYQLNALLNAQNTALAVNLHSDCTVFGENNVSVSAGGRYTHVSNPTASQTAANVQIGYRFEPGFRAGVFLDQGISNTTPSNYTVKNSQPLAGLFAVYAPSGTPLGLQVKASAGYSSSGVETTRSTLANTEAGQGPATMTSQGVQIETAYGFDMGDNWLASPLAGVRFTSVLRHNYTETAGATFPITFDSVTQSATTAYAGAKVMGYVTPQISMSASAGLEQDLKASISNYSGSIYYLGAFSLEAPSISQTRLFVAANADYWIENNQRLSLSAHYKQQPLNTKDGMAVMLNYTKGF